MVRCFFVTPDQSFRVSNVVHHVNTVPLKPFEVNLIGIHLERLN